MMDFKSAVCTKADVRLVKTAHWRPYIQCQSPTLYAGVELGSQTLREKGVSVVRLIERFHCSRS